MGPSRLTTVISNDWSTIVGRWEEGGGAEAGEPASQLRDGNGSTRTPRPTWAPPPPRRPRQLTRAPGPVANRWKIARACILHFHVIAVMWCCMNRRRSYQMARVPLEVGGVAQKLSVRNKSHTRLWCIFFIRVRTMVICLNLANSFQVPLLSQILLVNNFATWLLIKNSISKLSYGPHFQSAFMRRAFYQNSYWK